MITMLNAIRAVMAALFLVVQVAPVLAANNGTNVLMIIVDDLNDWVDYMKGVPGGGPPDGATADFTPNIDALANSGVAFTRAYSPGVICTPSRAAFLGGRRPGFLGVYDINHDYRQAFQDRGIVPITKQFMANGYDVIGAGKIYHPMSSTSALFNAADLYDTYTAGTNTGGEGGNNLNGMNEGSFDWGTPTSSDTNSKMLDYENATTIINAINATRSAPFFIVIGFAKPHLPWYVPATYFNQFTLGSALRPPTITNDLSDVPAPGVILAQRHGFQGLDEDLHPLMLSGSPNRWNAAAEGYLATIAFVDSQVGRVVNALNASSKANNTVVVLMGDHGFNIGEKDHWHKMALWERTTRVPLIFKGPGIMQGGISTRPVDLMAVYPTLTALTGVPTPSSGFDGVSIVPLLTNPAAAAPVPYAISTYWNGTNAAVHAVRTERYRYIKYANGTEELYDEQDDPHEWVNQASIPAYASIKATMAGYLPAGTTNNRAPVACFPGAGMC